MNWETLYSKYVAQLEDFWGRRETRPVHSREFTLFGRPLLVTSNDKGVLASVDFAQPLYSIAPRMEAPPFTIQLIVRPSPRPPARLPEDLVDQIQYTGYGDWLAIHLGPWGHCQIDLSRKRALAVLAPRLAEQPALVSRYLLNTILTNYLIASDYGYLHATGLLKGRQVLLLMAAHNRGKSTVALRLALAGYHLLSDSMIFVEHQAEAIRLYGFPVGRIKLRQDMVEEFPRLKPFFEKEPVRGELKYALDLRRVDPSLVHESVIEPSEICLCLLTLGDEPTTTARPAAMPEVMERVMANSLFYDKVEVWKRNLAHIQPIVEQARCYYLSAGSSPANLVAALDDLFR